MDQVQFGAALLFAWGVTGEVKYLEGAKELAEFVGSRLKTRSGGYHDICAPGAAYLKLPLTLIEQNGPAASFFLALGKATGIKEYRENALWGFQPFTGNFKEYGIHAAALGTALSDWLHSHGARTKQN
jgi:uncharacterized protein YyaL (SSP411 family)